MGRESRPRRDRSPACRAAATSSVADWLLPTWLRAASRSLDSSTAMPAAIGALLDLRPGGVGQASGALGVVAFLLADHRRQRLRASPCRAARRRRPRAALCCSSCAGGSPAGRARSRSGRSPANRGARGSRAGVRPTIARSSRRRRCGTGRSRAPCARRLSAPTDSKRTVTPGAAPLGGERRRVGTRPRSSRTIGPDVEDECPWSPRAPPGPWSRARAAPPRRRWVALEQALDDLRLERDVGDALGRSVVHLARDLAAHLLLRGQDLVRRGDGWRHRHRPLPRRGRLAGRGAGCRRSPAQPRRPARSGPVGRGSAAGRAACPRAPRAGLHHRLRAASAEQQLRARLASMASIGACWSGRVQSRAPRPGRVAPRAAPPLRLAWRRSSSISVSSRSSVAWSSLSELAVGHVKLGESAMRSVSSVAIRDQSSGIRIQPCFMA